MKKKFFQILILTGIALVGVQQAQAMISCEDAQGSEECSLIAPEELERLEAEVQNQASGQKSVSLPSNGDSNAPGVMIIHHNRLKNSPIGQKVAAKGYVKPSLSQFRSPLSKTGI